MSLLFNDLGIDSNLIEYTDNPTKLFLHCGRPKKIKKLEDNIGKRFEKDGIPCIITYSLNLLFDRGELFTRKIIYSLELFKHELLESGQIEYKDGKIRYIYGNN